MGGGGNDILYDIDSIPYFMSFEGFRKNTTRL